MGLSVSGVDIHELIACHDCDLLQRQVALQPHEVARCSRCGSVLYRCRNNSINRTLMLSLAALIMFVLANIFPFMTLELHGRQQGCLLITGVIELYKSEMFGLSLLVFLINILFPLLKIIGNLYVLLPLQYNWRPWKISQVFRVVETFAPWAMTEVYMLGVLVAYVKMEEMAVIIPGLALYSFAALIIFMTAASAALSPRVVWEQLDHRHV